MTWHAQGYSNDRKVALCGINAPRETITAAWAIVDCGPCSREIIRHHIRRLADVGARYDLDDIGDQLIGAYAHCDGMVADGLLRRCGARCHCGCESVCVLMQKHATPCEFRPRP